ncbi:MAG: glycosyltransferase [Bacteroidia bacterium]|nr:glycosyltransferase [Bacteroidia bacterium]
MHIGVLSDPGNFHTQKWASALQREGAKVTIFSFSDFVFDKVPCVQVLPSWTVGGKITYPSFLYSGENLRAALSKHKVDLVNPINITPYGVWAARSGFRHIVSIAMGADILEYPPQKELSGIPVSRTWASNQTTRPGAVKKIVHGLKWRVFRQEVQKALDASELITGDNQQLIYAMRDWFGVSEKKLKLNRWGVEPEMFTICETKKAEIRKKYKIRDWQKVILSPRGMKPVYQGDIILESFERLLRRGVRDAQFIMLSAGYDIPPEVDKKAKLLDSQFENFHYERGILPREEVSALWSVVDVFVNAPIYDGYSNALGEGRYAGAIPVVNDIPAHREFLQHDKNSRILKTFTPQHLADEILELIPRVEELKTKFAPVNRKWIEQHAMLDRNIRIFLRDCEKVLKQKR